MARVLYSLLLWLGLPLVLARLLWRARAQPDYLRHWPERFGRYAGRARQPVIWLHAVSVGEARAAAPLVEALAARHPDHDLVVTCMTPTGRATAQSLHGARARVVYLPYDYGFAVRAFLRHFRPRLGLVVETEIWPNLIAAARRAGVPVALVSARLSARSARRYARVAALARPAFAGLAWVGAQTAPDAERLRGAGAAAPVVTGNLKFDIEPDASLLALGRGWRAGLGGRRVVLAASTRDGEEALLLPVLCALAAAGHLVVVVPRHPQRFDEVAALLAAGGLALARRSAAAPPPPACAAWLGDSLGEMAAYFAMADCAYIGGSLLPFGGQNMIEAAACGCPALFGPHTWNFLEAADAAVAAGAAMRV
ncbi:MAG: 3-deoxy-D-manno-octulosonic acid transferase, partial [Burkholderiales bacterium]|nr:3-deoxy-D-manno-octulosonic acid transferase [Burkholderiales bacterium]